MGEEGYNAAVSMMGFYGGLLQEIVKEFSWEKALAMHCARATNLENELKSRGIKKLIIMGIQSDWCVDTTVRRAYSLEYDVTVVEDGHTTIDTAVLKAPQIIAHHNSIFGGRFAKLVKADQIDFKKL